MKRGVELRLGGARVDAIERLSRGVLLPGVDSAGREFDRVRRAIRRRGEERQVFVTQGKVGFAEFFKAIDSAEEEDARRVLRRSFSRDFEEASGRFVDAFRRSIRVERLVRDRGGDASETVRFVGVGTERRAIVRGERVVVLFVAE